MSVEIKTKPTSSSNYSFVFVNGVEVGTAMRTEDGQWLPFGHRKPKNLRAAALSMCTKKYDQAYREVDKYAALIQALDP